PQEARACMQRLQPFFITLKGPTNLGFNFPRMPKRTTPFQGETLSITLSPTSNSIGLRASNQHSSSVDHERLASFA
ncbi:hypothetical protein Tco_0354659, partial [Tanacetum coccineum]